MIEISHIPIEGNVVADALSRYPQEGGSYCEHLVDQEGIVDLDCYRMYSFHSLHARALQVDNFATSISVSAAEEARRRSSEHAWAAEQAATSGDAGVELVSRVSVEDLTHAH